MWQESRIRSWERFAWAVSDAEEIEKKRRIIEKSRNRTEQTEQQFETNHANRKLEAESYEKMCFGDKMLTMDPMWQHWNHWVRPGSRDRGGKEVHTGLGRVGGGKGELGLAVEEKGWLRDVPSSRLDASGEIEAFFGRLPPGKLMKYVILLLNHVWRLDACFHVVLGKRFRWPRMSGWSHSYIPAVNPAPELSDLCHSEGPVWEENTPRSLLFSVTTFALSNRFRRRRFNDSIINLKCISSSSREPWRTVQMN